MKDPTMTTTQLDQISIKATELAERIERTRTSIDELLTSPISPPAKSPASTNMSSANRRFADISRDVALVVATHGLATMLRRVGGEIAMNECNALIAKMNASLAHIEREIVLANNQFGVAAISVAKRVSLPGSSEPS